MKDGRPAKGTLRIYLPSSLILKTVIVVALLVSLLVSVYLHVGLAGEGTSILSFSGDLSPQTEVVKPIHTVGSLRIFQDPERKPILKILRQAGYDFNDPQIFTPEVWESLPRWSDVLNLYGREPIILGLETCKDFQTGVSNPALRQVSVAGLFNSGTNILYSLLAVNCVNKASRETQSMWQVPWGKHMPENQRSQHRTKGYEYYNVSNVLPVISIRDPYTWMQSMCRQAYAVVFDHSLDADRNLCPNLVPYEEDIRAHRRYKKMKYIPVYANYNKKLNIKYSSLAHLYNEWYNAYVNVTTYPRVMVRLEDIIFGADKVVPKICECFGGTYRMNDDSGVYQRADVANRNPGIDKTSQTSGLLGSIIKYGNRTLRRKHYRRVQFEAAKEILDPHLMKLFGYSFEDPVLS